MNVISKDERNAFFIIQRFESLFPELKHNLTADDIVSKLNDIQHCQISGLLLNKHKTYLIPLIPFEYNLLFTIERVAFVCKEVKVFFRSVFEYIIQNPDIKDCENFKNMNLIFKTTANSVKERYINHPNNSLFLNIDNYDELLKKAYTKTSDDLRRYNIQNIQNKSQNNFELIPSQKISKKREFISQVFPESIIKYKIRKCAERSHIKGLTCNMNMENTVDIFSRTHCALTGVFLDKGPNNSVPLPNTFSIDRINRFEGYNIHNIMVICHEANKIKGNLERNNYSEDPAEIKRILQETKKLFFKEYKNNPDYQFKKCVKINQIVSEYIKHKTEDKMLRCAF